MPERTWSAWHHMRCNEMARSGEQEMVEAFAAHSADPVFRVRSRACSNWGADEADPTAPVAEFGFIGAARHAATDGNKDEVKVVRDDASETSASSRRSQKGALSLSRHANRPEFFGLGVDIGLFASKMMLRQDWTSWKSL
jgi:hypothetical protein